MLFDYERDITTWRLDQITPVQICEITQHFSKKFEGVCETRWHRDTGLKNEDEFNDEKSLTCITINLSMVFQVLENVFSMMPIKLEVMQTHLKNSLREK